LNKYTSDLSNQEQDLAIFLEALGVKLPKPAPERADGYAVISLGPLAAWVFKSQDGRTVLLGYRYKGKIYPLSIHFLFGENPILFGHSVLLLESYKNDKTIVTVLRKALGQFFNHTENQILKNLEPSWENICLTGHYDNRIAWDAKPTLSIVVKTCLETIGEVPTIPLFPSVYPYDNPYIENLLEVGLPELSDSKRVLVLGTGSGIDAACIALKYKIPVDATDINPMAVANTHVTARRCGVGRYISAYTSDCFNEIGKKFDTIFFEAPLATENINETDSNRYDVEGAVLRRVLSDLPNHLLPGGRMFLMSQPDLSPYVGAKKFYIKTLRYFEPKSSVAIHEIRLEKF
jgi:hypothetical protein